MRFLLLFVILFLCLSACGTTRVLVKSDTCQVLDGTNYQNCELVEEL